MNVLEALRVPSLPLSATQVVPKEIERSVGHEEVQLLVRGIARTCTAEGLATYMAVRSEFRTGTVKIA